MDSGGEYRYIRWNFFLYIPWDIIRCRRVPWRKASEEPYRFMFIYSTFSSTYRRSDYTVSYDLQRISQTNNFYANDFRRHSAIYFGIGEKSSHRKYISHISGPYFFTTSQRN